MQETTQNELGTRPITKLMVQYCTPAIVAMAASSVYNIIDGIFIGQAVGEEAIAGLALSAPVMAITTAVGAMVGIGASTLMAVKLGQKDYDTAKSILGNVLIMNAIMGILLGFLLHLCLKPILHFFGASEATLPHAYNFMSIILMGNVVTHMYFGLNALLRSTNRPMKAMHATLGTVALNCLFAPVFIFDWGLDMGIRGAALATVLAQFIMLLWQFRLFSNKSEMIHLDFKKIRLRREIVIPSLTIGLSPFLINLCACIVVIFYTRNMKEFGGDTGVAAYGIVNRLLLFIIMIIIGLDQGLQPIFGFNYGARNYGRLLETLRKGITIATIVMVIGFIIGHFFPEPCVAIFAKDSPELTATAARGLRTVVLFFPIVGTQIVSVAFFQSIGFPRKSIFLSLTRQLLFLVPALWIIPHHFGHLFEQPLDAVWYCTPTADAFSCIISISLLVIEVRRFKRLQAEQIAS